MFQIPFLAGFQLISGLACFFQQAARTRTPGNVFADWENLKNVLATCLVVRVLGSSFSRLQESFWSQWREPATGSPGPRRGPPIFHPRGLTATSSTLTKPSETVVAGSKVPSALPANTRDVCVALGLVCACSCEQETVSSRIPGKKWNLTHGL